MQPPPLPAYPSDLDMISIRAKLKEAQHNRPLPVITRSLSDPQPLPLTDATNIAGHSEATLTPVMTKKKSASIVRSLQKRLINMKSTIVGDSHSHSHTRTQSHSASPLLAIDSINVSLGGDNDKENRRCSTTRQSLSTTHTNMGHRRRSSSLSVSAAANGDIANLHQHYQSIISEKDALIETLRTRISDLEALRATEEMETVSRSLSSVSSSSDSLSSQSESHSPNDSVNDSSSDSHNDNDSDAIDSSMEPHTPVHVPSYPLMTPGSSPLLTPGKLAKLNKSLNDSLISFKPSPLAAMREETREQPAESPRKSVQPTKIPSASKLPVARTPTFIHARNYYGSGTRTPSQSPAKSSPAKPVGELIVDGASDSVSAAWAMYLAKKGAKTKKTDTKSTTSIVTRSPVTPDSKRRKVLVESVKAAKRSSPMRLSFDDTKDIAKVAVISEPVAVVVKASPPMSMHQRSATVIDLLRSAALTDVVTHSVTDGTETVPLSIGDIKRISAELKRQRSQLHLSNDWTVRVKAMTTIDDFLATENSQHGITVWNDWSKELEACRPALIEQLNDLRSSIVREACKLLVSLSSINTTVFEREFDHYAPILYRGLYVTIKIIRDSCDECLSSLVTNTRSPKVMSVLLMGLTDNHSVVREKCSHYMHLLLMALHANTPTASMGEGQCAELMGAIVKHSQDSDNNTRVAVRQLYRTFVSHFPAKAAALADQLPSAVQKALEADRKASAKNSKASGVTKKKK